MCECAREREMKQNEAREREEEEEGWGVREVQREGYRGIQVWENMRQRKRERDPEKNVCHVHVNL